MAATKPDTFICGGISETPSYAAKKGKDAVQEEFQRQVDVFADEKMDFLLGEVENLIFSILINGGSKLCRAIFKKASTNKSLYNQDVSDNIPISHSIIYKFTSLID